MSPIYSYLGADESKLPLLAVDKKEETKAEGGKKEEGGKGKGGKQEEGAEAEEAEGAEAEEAEGAERRKRGDYYPK